jgi:hypothetical protein
MLLVGFEPTIPASKRVKTVHALDGWATVTGTRTSLLPNRKSHGNPSSVRGAVCKQHNEANTCMCFLQLRVKVGSVSSILMHIHSQGLQCTMTRGDGEKANSLHRRQTFASGGGATRHRTSQIQFIHNSNRPTLHTWIMFWRWPVICRRFPTCVCLDVWVSHSTSSAVGYLPLRITGFAVWPCLN